MVNIDTFRQTALSFPKTIEVPHFEKTSFKVGNKIFATLDVNKFTACIKLSEIEQNVFSTFDKNSIYPVPNKWGKQGWTILELDIIQKEIFIDALTTAYYMVAKKKPQ